MAVTVMGGKKGDIFWNLDPWIVYIPGYDIGARIFVANTTDTEKEYSLMARLSSDETLISEEAIPVYQHTWFTVKPGDFVTLTGALRFEETDVVLTISLVERETEEVTDSVSTRLMSPTTAGGAGGLPPTWPGGPGAGYDWGSLFMMFMPLIMMAMMVPLFRREKKEVKPAGTERKALPAGRGS